jgi:hypothetical protein
MRPLILHQEAVSFLFSLTFILTCIAFINLFFVKMNLKNAKDCSARCASKRFRDLKAG